MVDIVTNRYSKTFEYMFFIESILYFSSEVHDAYVSLIDEHFNVYVKDDARDYEPNYYYVKVNRNNPNLAKALKVIGSKCTRYRDNYLTDSEEFVIIRTKVVIPSRMKKFLEGDYRYMFSGQEKSALYNDAMFREYYKLDDLISHVSAQEEHSKAALVLLDHRFLNDKKKNEGCYIPSIWEAYPRPQHEIPSFDTFNSNSI